MSHRTAGMLFLALAALWLFFAWTASRSPASSLIARVEVGLAGVCLVLAIYLLSS